MAMFSISVDSVGSNVIPFPARGRDQDHEFKLRYHAANLLKAEWALTDAQASAAQDLETQEVCKAARARHWHLFDQLVEAVDCLARLPATSWRQLQLKRSIIGKVWLNSSLPCHAHFRELVDADERLLECAAPKRRRLR